MGKSCRSVHEKDDENGGSIRMTSNLACCSEESWDIGRYVGGCACVFTEAFLSPNKRCCLGYLERRTCQKK